MKHLSRKRTALAVLVFVALVCVAALSGGAGRSSAASVGARESAPVAAVATPALRSFPKAPASAGAPTVAEGLGRGSVSKGAASAPSAPDRAAQRSASLGGDAPVTLGAPIFTPVAGQSGGNPPDTDGDVGPKDFVQVVNTSISVFDKKGNQRAGFPKALNTLWSTLPAGSACRVRNDGDPIVLYDQQVDRWMVAQFTNPNSAQGPSGTFPMCIAYSQTGDPTGAYFAYQFNLPRSDDYEKFGIWPDGLYMSDFEGGNLGAYVFDRSAMVSGSPATFIDFGSIGAGSGVNGRGNRILPADWDGSNPPPAGAPDPFVVSFDDAFDGGSDRLVVYEAHTDWTTPANSTFTQVATLNTVAFDTSNSCSPTFRDCIPQPGTSQKVDDLSNRLMYRLQYRNFGDHESMVVNQTVDGDGNNRAGVRWYELRHGGGNWSIFQQGTFAPIDGINRWMGAAAMDGAGDIAVGYNVSDGTSTFPGLRYTGRTPSDPLGSLPAGEQTLWTGTTSNTGSNRWGDYSALAVDPVDDCTYWFTGEVDGAFGTAIGAFRFSNCGTDLSISKTVTPAHPNAGEEAVYTITVNNNGSVDATNVVVTDALPSQVSYLADTASCTGVAVGSTGTLSCPLGTIPAGGSSSFQIKVKINPDLGGPTSITNTATVSSDTADSDSTNNTVSLTHLVNESADLAVTKFCKPDTTAPAGTNGICQIFVHNYGPSAARGVSLSDTHVSNGAFTLGPVSTSQGSCLLGATTVSCSLGKIQPDGTVEVDVQVSSLDGVSVNDTAQVSSLTPDPNTANDQAQAGLTFTASADLSITKSDSPDPVIAGNNLTYTVNVHNAGPSTATGVTAVDNLPSGVTFVSASATVGTFTQVGSVVTWTVGNMAAGASGTLTIVVKVNPQTTGQIVNSASISSQTSDPNTANNSAAETTTVNAVSGLTLTKTDSPDPVLAGNNLTYTLTVGNGGPSTATNVVVTDTLPGGTTLVSAVGGTGSTVCAEVQVGIVSCDVGSLDPGQTRTIFITVKVAASVSDGTVLTNNAQATSPSSPTANASATTTVHTQADLWIDKQGQVSAANPAPAITYLITVHNALGSVADDTPTSGSGGPSDAQNIVVTDPLPLDNKKVTVQFLSPGCTYDKPSHTVTCKTATLPFGTAVTFQIQIQVQGSNGTLQNSATVTSTTPDPTAANNKDTVNNVVKGGTGKK